MSATGQAATTNGAAGSGNGIGGPTKSSWREDWLARIAELEMLTSLVRAETQTDAGIADALEESIRRHLAAAREAAAPASHKGGLGGADVTRVTSNVEAAEAGVLRLAP